MARARHWVAPGETQPAQVTVQCSHDGTGAVATIAVVIAASEPSWQSQPWGGQHVTQIRGPRLQVLRDNRQRSVELVGDDSLWVSVGDQEALQRLGLDGSEPERVRVVYRCRTCEARAGRRMPVIMTADRWAQLFGELLKDGESVMELRDLRARHA